MLESVDRRILKYSAALTILLFCVSSLVPIPGPREAYSEVGYGLPFHWIVHKIPNKAVAIVEPDSIVEMSLVRLLIDIVVAFFFSMTIVSYFVERRRKRLLSQGRCRECGYDLCGLESEVCPECGTCFDPELLNERTSQGATNG